MKPTIELVYNAIYGLRKQEEPPQKDPSWSWFMKWWKSNGLHKIKTKPIAVVRVTANDAEEVRKWFKRYRRTLRKYGFKPKDIINFNKARFRVGCLKGQ